MPADPTPPKTPAQEAKEIGRALKRLREDAGLTQDAAAEGLGVTRTAWQNYEGGRAVILRTDLQARAAAALGRTRQDLLAALRQVQTGPTHSSGVAEGAAIFAGPGRSQAVFPLDEGDVILSFPANLSAEGRQQLEDYLAVFLRKRGA